jgi:hypothetical protein
VIQAPSPSPPETTFSTPGGSTSRRISPSFRVESGVKGEGLMTTVFPAKSAGAIFQMPSSTGKFHGVMAPTTPWGRRRTSMRVSASSWSTSTGISSDAVYWNQSAPPISSIIAFSSGLPCSCVRIGASSCARA